MHDFIGYFMSWCKSQDGYHAVTPVCVDICLLIISFTKKQSQWKKAAQEFQLFNFIIYMEEKQTHFVESSDSDIKS